AGELLVVRQAVVFADVEPEVLLRRGDGLGGRLLRPRRGSGGGAAAEEDGGGGAAVHGEGLRWGGSCGDSSRRLSGPGRGNGTRILGRRRLTSAVPTVRIPYTRHTTQLGCSAVSARAVVPRDTGCERSGGRMTWTQTYDPLGSALLSPLAAAVPVVVLLGLLASGRVSAPGAAPTGLVAAILIAVFAFAPPEARDPAGPGTGAWAGTVLAAAGYGAAFGLLPIGWIVLNAVFLYVLTVEAGAFDVVKRSVLALSDDRRAPALLIAFCFGAFLEGAAGFGTPVAVTAALMVGAGF